MPLFSDHISNMYYSGSSSYNSSPYSYSTAIPSYGSSFSASYLNPGGNYSTHSSLGGYSRAPLSSRWITSGGRAYSPMLSTISEKGTSSPVRINSPRRIPISGRTYVPSTYTPRPININTADIDVSRDKYRSKVQSSSSTTATGLPPRRESPSTNKENGHDKPDTGVDTSPGPKRSTIKRDRTVVRLHTLKRKERDSPRKPVEVLNDATNASSANDTEKQTESKKWRQKLADDLAYKTQKEKKSLGAKLVEKFTLKDKNEDEYENHTKISPKNYTEKEKSPLRQDNNEVISSVNKSFDRRCSMELLAEQASLLDSLIRRENLSIAPLDMSKVGSENMLNTDINLELELQDTKKRKLYQGNCLSTTKSDHSLHDRLFSRDVKDPSFPKRRSLRKCSSSGSIRKLDCIKEKPKKLIASSLPPVEDESKNKKSKPKIKTRITSTVEVTPTTPQLKFIVENVTVEETSRPCKKDIIFSSTVEENPSNVIANELDDNEKSIKLKEEIEPLEVPVVLESIESVSMKDKKSSDENIQKTKGHRKSIKKSKTKEKSKAAIDASGNLTSPEPEDGNFWDKIGKRETIYIINRKQILDQVKEQNKRTLFWFPEEEYIDTSKEKNENLDGELFSRKISADPIDESIINIEAKSPNETVKIQKGNKNATEAPEIEKSNTEILDLSNTEDKTHCSLKKTILDANASTTVNLTSAGKPPSSKTCKKIELDKDSKKEKIHINKSKESDDIDHKMKPTKEIVKSKNIPNECESVEETIKSIHKPEGTETMNSSKTKNSLNRENLESNQNISSLKASIMLGHSEEIPSNSNQKSSEIECTQSLDITKDSSETMTTKIPAKLSPTKHSQKDNIKNKSIMNDTNGSSETINDAKLSANLSTTKQYSQEDKIKNESIKNDTRDSSEIINAEKICLKTSPIKNSRKDDIKSKLLTNVTKNSSETINAAKLSAELSPTKQSQKDNIQNQSMKSITKDSNETINSVEIYTKHSPTKQCEKDNINNKSIKNNNETIINAEANALENLNIPRSEIIESTTDKSITKKNTNICEINEAKTDIKDVVSTSSLRLLSEVITPSQNKETKQEVPIKVEVENVSASIPNSQGNTTLVEEKLVKNNEDKKESNIEIGDAKTNALVTNKDSVTIFTNTRPVKEEKAIKPLIATPRPLQKKNPQTIRYSSSSSEDDSSEEETDEDGDDEAPKSGSSQGSTEYLECENNPDGRTSTGSNDSGFDSSAPTSPSGFLHAKKGGDSPSTSAGVTSPQTFTHDILEQELEQSTAYDLFRKTGRFTPPARSIPRFRKYTIEDFQFIRVLGKGSFGKVMLAELRGTEYYYAVKCLKKDVVLEDDDVECTLIERKVLALGTNHPYLCHLFATFQTDSHLFFVMEYLNGGDLMFHIQQSGRFPEPRARFYAAEIVSGLKFLHKRGIVYRDLKLDNILLDFEGHVRIADFGMCKLQIYLDKTADTFCGTPDYMAPEIIRGLKYNQTVDWWSFGVLLYEMLIGQSPFSGCDEDELFWSICNEMPSYPRFLSPESLSILTRLLDKDATTRLGAPECMHGDIRDQKFFEQIQWDRLERRELEAPFKPRVRHPMDTQYFDRAFTGERPRLTAVEPQVLRSMDQEPFRGFSYTNPNATDR